MIAAIVTLSIIFIVLFFLQLNQGALGGIQSLSGQELELFKENKERKVTKILRRITLLTLVLIIVLSAVVLYQQNHTEIV